MSPGRVQLETGFTWQQQRGTAPATSLSFPELLLRIGILDRAELRISENYLVEQPAGNGAPSVRGFDDTYLATKVSLSDSRGAVPALAFEVQVDLPTGARSFAAPHALPGGALLLGWEGHSRWSAGVELFARQAAEDEGQGVASLSVQYELARSVTGYGEVYAVAPWNSTTDLPTQYANAGLEVLLDRNVQVDARIGAGLDRAAARLFTGVGFSVRR